MNVPVALCIHDELQAYIHELKQYSAAAPCSQTLKQFVVQDFCKRTQSSRVSKEYNFISYCSFMALYLP